MNDIRLRSTVIPDKYDWSFNWNDVDVVRGNMQLVNAVKHAVLLRPNELIQEAYQDKGCQAHNYIYHGNSENERTLEAGAIETSAKSVKGVYTAKCTITENEEYESNIQLKLLTDDMEELEVNEL